MKKCGIYRIKKQKPEFYNDGEGFVDIKCLEDKTKNLCILQSNCVLSNRQIVKIYEYLQKNPHPDIQLIRVVSKKFGSYREGPDSELSINFHPKKGKTVTVHMADLPDARNPALMKALTTQIGASMSRSATRE